MKSTLLIIAAVALGLAAPEAAAQQEKGENGKRPWKGGPPALRDMDQDMRERFRKASRTAMEDPEIQALKKKADDAAKAFREAMRKAVAEADPELAREVREKVGSWKQGKHMPKGLRHLPEEDRDRLMAARKIAMQAPSVQEAKSALDAAGDGPQRREAAERYRAVLREAILTADPSLKDTLENIGRGKRGEEESD